MFENKQLVFLSFFVAFITMLVAIIIPEFLKVPYAFYNIIRLFAFTSLGFITYFLFKQKNLILSFLVGTFTILYNPLTPIFLTRNIWIVIDIIIILVLIICLIKLITTVKNNSNFDNKIDCIVSQELVKLINYGNKNYSEFKDKHEQVKLIGVTLGGFNKHFLEKLYKEKNIVFPNTSVFELIKYLANNNIYNKDIINDLYSINDIRNRIIHDEDRTPITKENIDFFLNFAKSSIHKAEFLYKNANK